MVLGEKWSLKFDSSDTPDKLMEKHKNKDDVHYIIDRFGDSLYNHEDLMQKCKYSHKYKIPWTGIDTVCKITCCFSLIII